MPDIPIIRVDSSHRREEFFHIVFGGIREEGYICLARRAAGRGVYKEQFFSWPDDLSAMAEFVDRSVIGNDVWFSPMLYDSKERRKERVLTCPVLWSDLDACEPDNLLVPPSVALETSEGRYQALWILDVPAPPVEAEELTRRIAYRHKAEGADTTGWDLTQLLRVPDTYNWKYNPPALVQIVYSPGDRVTIEQMRSTYPEITDKRFETWPFPEAFPASDAVLEKYRHRLPDRIWNLLEFEPEFDWSKSLWNLEITLCEADLDRDEVFSVAEGAACNKYRRDGRTQQMLWLDVCKAWSTVHSRFGPVNGFDDVRTFKNPQLLSDEDQRAADADQTFVDDYIDWAKTTGDAAEAYHEAGAFTALSSVLSGLLQLPTSFGMIIPNLWFLLIADTTLTRKSTALDLAVDMALEVDKDVIMATDGSMEGLFSALAIRPGQPSIFLRDEFSGLLDTMQRRDYYAGMAEVLTKLYDGKFQKRQLRREVIEVRDPVLLFLAGGTRARVLHLLTIEHITSGFLPRFVIITAESDITKMQPLKPPDDTVQTGRKALVERLAEIKRSFTGNVLVRAGQNGSTFTIKNKLDVEMTAEAWDLYNEMELKLITSGFNDKDNDVMTPTMDRLSKSGLKASILIAASRKGGLPVVVGVADVLKAFSYVSLWREYAIDILAHIGISQTENQIQHIYQMVRKQPGITRGSVMRQYHLTSKSADMILDTLAQRGQIQREKVGRGERLEPIG